MQVSMIWCQLRHQIYLYRNVWLEIQRPVTFLRMLFQRWSFFWRQIDSCRSSALADSDVHSRPSETLRDIIVYQSTSLFILFALSSQSVFVEVISSSSSISACSLHVFTLFRCVGFTVPGFFIPHCFRLGFQLLHQAFPGSFSTQDSNFCIAYWSGFSGWLFHAFFSWDSNLLHCSKLNI